MSKNLTTVTALILAFTYNAFSQDSLSLKDCIEYALVNNPSIIRAEGNLGLQETDYLRTKSSLLPNLNANGNQNYNFGRTIDPATNEFVDQKYRTNYFSLNADVLLFNGLQKQNELRRSKWQFDAGKHNLQKIKDDISLTIASKYLQILLLQERELQISNLVSQSLSNQEKIKKLVEAGSLPVIREYEANARLASDQSLLIEIQSQLNNAYLDLKQMMNYDPTKELYLKKVQISKVSDNVTENALTDAITQNINNLPGVKYAGSIKESALYGYKSAKSNISPKIFANGSLHTVYSSSARNFAYQFSGFEPIGFLSTDSTPVMAPRYVTSFNSIPFNEQIKNNFGESFGISLMIPIFNGLQTRYSIQTAHYNYLNAELSWVEAQNQAKNDIYRAYEAVKMSRKKHEASQLKLRTQELLYDQTDISFNAGALGYYEWLNARTNLQNAQSEELQARYEYIFQLKIFDYYTGKPVEF